jgi:hypothetical protein
MTYRSLDDAGTNSGLGCARMLQERSERGVGLSCLLSTRSRMLVRGAARRPDLDKFALFLQPVPDGRRECWTGTVKLIRL